MAYCATLSTEAESKRGWRARLSQAGGEYRIARCVFLRLLAVVYLIAFVSLWVQAEGLMGPRGIQSVDSLLEVVRGQVGPRGYWLAPTLSWVLPGGSAGLYLLCGAGTLCSVLLLLGLLPIPCLVLLWVLYLSLTIDAWTFLSFQWDNLLLETGFLAIFLAPRRARCRLACAEPVPNAARWLLVWLLFRLAFSSGYVKLASGDPTWRSLTALQYHYETQPIPTWTAWYAHQTPPWFQALSCAVMFVVELAVPFLFFVPRWPRRIAAAATAGFQAILAATGNFAFFNLLTVALCVPLLDDVAWPRPLRRLLGSSGKGRARGPAPLAFRVAAGVLLAAVFAASLSQLGGTLGLPKGGLGPLAKLDGLLSPLRTVNSYGLFMVMTTRRPEIVVEGSEDGRTWLAYEFKWKPGDPRRAPPFVAPHQPRLDWQMWFAALSRVQAQPWFVSFMHRLLEESPPVLDLLERNPFPNGPPRYVRAMLYDYRFTDFETRRREGTWWRRTELGLYCPVLSSERVGAEPVR